MVLVSFPVPVGNPVGRLLSSLDWFFVGLNIEVDEEAEVACKQCAAEDGSALGSGTVSIDGQTWVVSGREVRVSSEIDNEQVNHKLNDLHRSKVLLPPNSGTSGTRVVIVIHYNMHREIERDNNP